MKTNFSFGCPHHGTVVSLVILSQDYCGASPEKCILALIVFTQNRHADCLKPSQNASAQRNLVCDNFAYIHKRHTCSPERAIVELFPLSNKLKFIDRIFKNEYCEMVL